MDYPSLPLSATSVNIQDGGFSPLYDIVWSINYEIVNWSETDEYGLCFFLRESEVPSQGGGVGIDLGYSGHPGVVPGQFTAEGLTGSIVGIGLDTHGAFAAQTTWPSGVVRTGLSDSSLVPNSVTVRGGYSDSFAFLDSREVEAFNLLSDGPKILRARLGNFGRTAYLDYRAPGDTEFVNLIEQTVDFSFNKQTRLTPGVSFSKPLTSTNTNLNIKVNTFHVEGRGKDPETLTREVDELTPLGCSQSPLGVTIYDEPVNEVVYRSPVNDIELCQALQKALSFTKFVTTQQAVYSAGDTVSYNVALTNTGEQTLTNVVVVDTLLDDATNIVDSSGLISGTSLASGESANLTYDYIVKFTDEGTINNTATVTCSQLPAQSSSAEVSVGEVSGLVVTKETLTTGPYNVGDDIEYKVTIINRNAAEVTNITITDTQQGDYFTITSDPGNLFTTGKNLAGGGTVEATYTYTVQVSDIGALKNVVSVNSDLGDYSASATVVIGDAERLVVNKEIVTTSDYYKQGDTIEYKVTVTNPNAFDVSGVEVSDEFSVGEGLDAINITSDPNNLFSGTTLGPGETAEATYEWTVNINKTRTLTNSAVLRWSGTDGIIQTEQSSASVILKGVGCIFVSLTDENSLVSAEDIDSGWKEFRKFAGQSRFAILSEASNQDPEAIALRYTLPDDFELDKNANVLQIYKNTFSEANTLTDDWYELLELGDYAPGSRLYLWYDDSTSQDGLDRYTANYNELVSKATSAGITVTTSPAGDTTENWIDYHTQTVSTPGFTTCTF